MKIIPCAESMQRDLYFVPVRSGDSANGNVPPDGTVVVFREVTYRISTLTHMAHLTATLPNQDRLRILVADRTSMSTQLLVEALARDGQFQMIESPSNEAFTLSFAKREKPHVAVLSAELGENGRGAFDLVRNIR